MASSESAYCISAMIPKLKSMEEWDELPVLPVLLLPALLLALLLLVLAAW